ncbi:hypothetical protein L484_021641 [Morus notabilis]|uniref:Uncharacterized protein n=1 Tax=Morus notabilis TaxID=981085 RepID=W9SV76_9ROSA|nr:hypothetical protein L484_021641 [Morus notabilis]
MKPLRERDLQRSPIAISGDLPSRVRSEAHGSLTGFFPDAGSFESRGRPSSPATIHEHFRSSFFSSRRRSRYRRRSVANPLPIFFSGSLSSLVADLLRI